MQEIQKQVEDIGLVNFKRGAVGCLNPQLTIEEQAEFLRYDRKFEFPKNRLKFGAFSIINILFTYYFVSVFFFNKKIICSYSINDEFLIVLENIGMILFSRLNSFLSV